MNKLLVCFLLLSSCSSIDYGYFDIFLEGRDQPKINITKDILAKSEYSFIKVKQGKKEATFVLLSSNNGIETWIGSNYERIHTYKGLIIRTVGLDQDINFSEFDFEDVISNFPDRNFSIPIALTNPELDLGLLRMIFKESLSDSSCSFKAIYESQLKYTRSRLKNTFCYDKSGLPTQSQQNINPAGKKIELEFYYKF